MDLLDKGFTLADVPGRVTWADLMAMVRRSPRTSALFQETFGEQALLSTTDHLLLDLYDLTAMLLWMQSADGQKGRNRPKPRKRPGAKDDTRSLADLEPGALREPGEFSAGSAETAMTITEFDAIMASWWEPEPN